jgi:hypothetical protein
MATADDWCLTEVVSSVGATRFFRKNLQPRIAPGDAKYAILVFVTFRYESSDPRCLPEEHDRQALDGLDSSEVFDLEHDGIAVHVAAVLGSGTKDLLFYVRDMGAFAERVLRVLERHSRFTPSCEFSRDPNWGQYAEFPGVG